MSQLEKKAGLLRRTSSSKKPLKEKVVLMYDEIFTLVTNTIIIPETFILCICPLLQTLCALFRGVHQKNKSASGFDIINMLVGFDKAELRMKVCVQEDFMKSLESLLCIYTHTHSHSPTRSLSLNSVFVLQVTDNISQNTILEYVMINSIFEAILQILSDVSTRGQHGYDAVVLLALLVNYRKYESVNPYIVKLSIVDDEPTLDVRLILMFSPYVCFSRQYKDKEDGDHGGFFSTLTSMVRTHLIQQTNEAILLALYEAVHLNRNFITVLAQSHPEIDIPITPITPVLTTPTTPLGTTPPSMDMMNSSELPLDPNLQTSNLLITFLKYSSIVMQDTKDEHRLNSARLCLIILTCITEVCTPNNIVGFSYLFQWLCCMKCIRIIMCVSLPSLFPPALINLLKFLLSNETVLLAKHNIFHLALLVRTHPNP
uniref:Armadillo like helical domain containing 3 n=1 Tax=Hucho hucho TaxID=62062 RepID=A0A4W5LEP8_9TELE